MDSFVNRARFWWEHRWATVHMSEYLDGELASRFRVRMESHVGECDDCRLLLAGLREMVSALRRLPAPSGGGDPHQIAVAVRRRLGESRAE